jgi:hypothetical protein
MKRTAAERISRCRDPRMMIFLRTAAGRIAAEAPTRIPGTGFSRVVKRERIPFIDCRGSMACAIICIPKKIMPKPISIADIQYFDFLNAV